MPGINLTYSFSENQNGEKFVEELNRADFSGMNSIDFFDGSIDADFGKDNTLYLVVGSDSGLLLPYLKKRASGRGSRVVVIEHDDVYPLVAAEYRGLLSTHAKKHSSNDLRISLHSHSSWVREVFDGSDTPWMLGGAMELVESNASAADYSRLYMPVLRAIRKSIEERYSEISVSLSRKKFTALQFRNAADSTTPLKADELFGKDKTTVILGGGPSLDMHLEWVKEHRQSLFIIAVSRIANKLQKHELKPDILVSVDPYNISYEICKTGVLWTDVPLVYNYHVAAELLQQWQGPTFYLGKRLPWHTEKQTAGNVPSSGPTVSHAAVVVAAKLGFSQILMTGVDLCFSRSASTHAEDSPEQMIHQMPSLCNAQVETYSGRRAGTSISFKSSSAALESIGAMINRTGPILYNMSPEATRCPSIPYIDFQDVKLPTSKPEFIQSVQPADANAALNELARLKKELSTARHAFTKMRSLSIDAKKLVADMHNAESVEKKSKCSTKLTRTRKSIQNDYNNYLSAIIQDNGVDFSKTATPIDFEDMTSEELIDWGTNYYKLVESGAQAMMDYIDEMQPRIQLRQDEHSPDVDIRELAKRWRDDETPGRILRWKKQYWKNVKPKDRAWVQRAIGKFRATLNEPNAKATDNLVEYNRNIDNVMRSLVFLSESKSLDELQAIEAKLDEQRWPYSALKRYTAGLISEIENEVATAVTGFQASIDICSERLEEDADSLESMQRLIEDCLVRMTSAYIGLKDYPSATTTLGILCEMLPSYVISYAKLLNLCDQKEFAVQLLESYIELYPENKKARLALAEISPGTKSAALGENNPVYVQKISGAVQAIMGTSPDRAA